MKRLKKVALSALFKRVEGCLWDANREAGLPRFLELANILFLKLLEERQQGDLWEALKRAENKIHYLNHVLIPHLQECYNAHHIFTPTQITKEDALKKIFGIVDGYHLGSFQSDILGDAFEYFLRNHTISKQNLGQYFTPRPLAKIMAAIASPTITDTIYDPFCGAGGLLVEAFQHLKAQGVSLPKETMFFGKDISASARAAQMNAILHWGTHSGIEQVANTLEHPLHEQYTIGLANVPFARDPNNTPYNGLYQNGLAAKKTDVLSILHLFQAIQKGGRMVAIVPEGFLLGKERAAVRRFLTNNADLRLVVSLPHTTFLPHTHTKAALIYLDNVHHPSQKSHFWYWDADAQNSLESLGSINFPETPEEDLIRLGYAKIPFEKVRQNNDIWMGKQYLGSAARSRYPLVPLGDLVTLIPTGFPYKANQLADGGIPLFTLKFVTKGFSPHGGAKFLKHGTPTQEKNLCREGDILVAVKDKNRRSPILGKAAIADQKGIFSSDLAKVEVKAHQAVLGEYLYYFFKNDTYAKEIKKFAAGSIMKSIRLEDMAAIKIPLPPLPVQQEAVKGFKRYEQMIWAQNEATHLFQEKCQEQLKALWG